MSTVEMETSTTGFNVTARFCINERDEVQNISIDDKVEDYPENAASVAVYFYGGIFLTCFGVTGNVLTVIIMRREIFKGRTTVAYLTALAIVDLIVIVVSQFLRHMMRGITGIDLPSSNTIFCKVWYFVIYSSTYCSSWILATLTIERAVAVTQPLKTKEICTMFKAKVIIVSVVILSCVLNVHYFWSYGETYATNGNITVIASGCTISEDNPWLTYYMMHYRAWVDLLIRSALPFMVITLCNIVIVRRLLSSSKNTTLNRMVSTHHRASKRKSMDNQMTSLIAMLVSVSVAYLFLTGPLVAIYLIEPHDPSNTLDCPALKSKKNLKWSIVLFLFYLNNAINFCMYIVSGKEFRREIKAMWKECTLTKMKKAVLCIKDDSLPSETVWTTTNSSEAVLTASLPYKYHEVEYGSISNIKTLKIENIPNAF